MNRRIFLIVGAILLAIVGTGAVYAYVSNADSRAVAGRQPVSVLIVTKQIPAGTSALDVRNGGYVRLDHMPTDATPQGSVDAIAGDWQSEVATADIAQGQVLLRAMFGSHTPTTSGLAIPAGKMAVSVRLNVDEDVAGYVQPGSQIAIFDTFTLVMVDGKNVPSGGKTSGGGGTSDNGDSATKLLLPRVDVLAVSQAAPAGTKPAVATSNANASTEAILVTVALDQADAERLIHVAQTGNPYAALLSSSSVTGPAPGVDNQGHLGQVFDGGITAP